MKPEIAPGPPKRTLRGYLWLASALIICPCHLPLLLALASGTALATLLRANWNLAVALSMAYVIVALLFAYRKLDGEGACAIPRRGRNPVLALVLSAFLPGLGQGYNRQWLKAGVLFVAGAASAYLLLGFAPTPNSVTSVSVRLFLMTGFLAAVEVWSMVDAYRVAWARQTH